MTIITTRHTAAPVRLREQVRVRATSEPGVLGGHATVFNEPYAIGPNKTETIAPSAFVEDLADRPVVPIFWGHGWAKNNAVPIGVARLRNTDLGVEVEQAVLNMDNPDARAIWHAAEGIDGEAALRDWSLGFNAHQVVTKGNNETIVRGKVLELSVVLSGAANTELVTREARLREADLPTPYKDTAMTTTKDRLTQRMRELAAQDERDRLSPGDRFVSSPIYEETRTRSSQRASETRVPVLDIEELAVRLRTVTGPTGMEHPQTPRFTMAPSKGGRVVSLLQVVPDAGPSQEVAVETSRDEVAGFTPFGTNLPEGGISFTSEVLEGKRVGLWIPATRGVFEDAGQTARVVDRLVDDEFGRVLDNGVLNGPGGSDDVEGLLVNADVPVQPKGGDTRWKSILRAAAAIKGNDYLGPLSVVLNPTDAFALLTDASSGIKDWDQDIADVLNLRLVASSLAASGTVLVGDYFSGATLFLREGVVVSVSTEHGDFFLTGKVAVAAEARAELEIHSPRAFTKITGF